MDITISVNDANQLLGLERALAAQNAARSTPLTEAEFVQGLVVDQCAAFAQQHLVMSINALDFQMRFTAAERVAIRTAAQTNGAIADYLGLLAAAPTVNLTDPISIAGVQALEAATLIAQGRAAQILAL